METNEYRFASGLNYFNWMKLPALAGKLSRKLLVAATDGYIFAATKAGAILTPLVFAAGFIWGWKHFGYQYVYTENLWFLLTAVTLGSLGGHFGLFFTIGFILGDFFFSGAHFVRNPGITKHLALLISYIVLIFITVSQSSIIKYLVSEIKLPKAVDIKTRLAVAGLLYTGLTWFFIYFWTKMAPVLIRPVFTWHGSQPTVEAITVLQNKFRWLAWAGAAVAALRFIFQSIMAMNAANQPFFKAMEDYYIRVSERRSLSSFIQPWIKIFIYACITAFTLSGMLLNWKTGLITGALAFFFQALTAGLIPRPQWLNWWALLVYKIPSLFRIMAAFLLLYYISNQVISRMWSNNTNAFLPLVVAFCCAFFIFFLFNPGKPVKPAPNENNQ